MNTKPFLTICFTTLLTVMCYSQYIVVNNAISRANIKGFILNKAITKHYLGIEKTFLEKEDKNYYLSVEVGLLTKGSKESIPTPYPSNTDSLQTIEIEIEENFNYLIINPSFRYKIPYPDSLSSHIYVGAGPRVDFLVSENEFKLPFSNLEAKSIIFGASFEVGAIHDIKNFRFGVQGQYNLDFSKLTNSAPLKGNTFTLGILLGYRLF